MARGAGTKEQQTWRRPRGWRAAGSVREEEEEEEKEVKTGGLTEEGEGEHGEESCLAPPTSSSHPGGGSGGLEGLHLVLFRTMRRSGGGF